MAKKFKFRVEAVLRMREQAEQAALRKMAEARRQVNKIEQGIRDLRAELAEQDRHVREGVLTGSVDVQYMSLYRRHVMSIHRQMIDMGRELHDAASVLGMCRAEATEAMKQRKVLSTLKDKQRSRYLRELDRQEVIETDDITATRHEYGRSDQRN